MTGPKFQHSFLGEASLRIQRALDLDGVISPQYDGGAVIIPTILVANGMDPGMGDFRNRRWMAALFGGAAARPFLRVTAGSRPVILDEVIVTSDLAGQINLRLAFNQADAAAGDQATLLDRTGSGPEFVAGLISGTQATVGTVIGTFNLAIGQPLVFPCDFLLAANADFSIQHTGAGSIFATVKGRLF